jgi:hypothetical protein
MTHSPQFVTFVEGTKIAKLCQQVGERAVFREIVLNNSFLVPRFHRSVLADEGVYLIGGESERGKGSSSTSIYRLDMDEHKLIEAGRMLVGRKSHCLTFKQPYLYICSGITHDTPTNTF